MSRRSKKGALLGLVVFCALILVVLGFGLLFLIMQLGGGQELQHATDAGNLNVAKQVLRHPGVVLQAGDEQNHFGDSDDDQTGEVNLLTINKLVAQTFLVSANAQALGTPQAQTHAGEMMDLLEGVSSRLNTELINSSNFDSHFGTVAQNHAMRMFEAGTNPVLHMGTEHAVSLMVRGEPTNVFLDSNQILAGAPTLDNANSVKVNSNPADHRRFLKGYTQLAAEGSETLWGVPLRPGQPPHLVSQTKFNQDQTRGPIPDFVPPNAYRSAGRATDKTASLSDTRALSMSLVGSLATQFSGDIRRGVIIVDNTGSLNGVSFAGGFDIWQDKLMSPNYVEVLGPNANTGLIADQSGGGGTLGSVKAYVSSNYAALVAGDPTAQSGLANALSSAGIDSYGSFGSNPTSLSQNISFINFVNSSSVTPCNNYNTGSGRQPCNLQKFVATYGEPGSPGTTGTPVNNLMAVEKYHVDICAERASGSECATINASAANTGLKYYTHGDCGLTMIRTGKLGELISQTSSSAIIPQMVTYMHQMKPGASTLEINGVFGSDVAFNKVSYIYLDPVSGSLTLTQSVPPWPLPNLSTPGVNLPDGTPQNYNSGIFDLNGITNCSGECGYPHPWDCPGDSQGTGLDSAVWTPSSGFRNILGVLKLRNKANGGGQFCCPC